MFWFRAHLRTVEISLSICEETIGTVMIKLTGVKKSFNLLEVLKGIDLELLRGDSMVLIGGSGSGKSLLMKSMIGLMCPDDGLVLLGQMLGHIQRNARCHDPVRPGFDRR